MMLFRNMKLVFFLINLLLFRVVRLSVFARKLNVNGVYVREFLFIDLVLGILFNQNFVISNKDSKPLDGSATVGDCDIQNGETLFISLKGT